MVSETYWELMGNWPHWAFELTLMALFDIIIGMILWPFAKKWLQNHDTKKHAHEHCDDIHGAEDNDNNYEGDKASDYEFGNN